MKNDYIDLRDNGTRPEPEREPMTEQRHKLITFQIVLTGAELYKIICALGVTAFAMMAIVLAFLSVTSFWLLRCLCSCFWAGLLIWGLRIDKTAASVLP